MITDVIVTNSTLTVITDSGDHLEAPLQSLKAVCYTCQSTEYDCINQGVAQKLKDAQKLINQEIKDRYFSQTK